MSSAGRIDLRAFLLSASFLLAHSAGAQALPDPTAPAQQPAATLKTKARIVVVDVSVTDSSGNPIKGLKAPDFAVKENGQPQTILQFEAHTADAVKQPDLPKMDANVFTNYTPTPSNGALNVLLLDSLNTPMKDQAYVHAEILKYLKTQAPGTRMAIFGLNGKLILLQGFTSDPAILKAAIESGKKGPKASVMMDNAVTGDAGASDPMQSVYDSLANDPDATTALANMQMFSAEMATFQTQLRVQMTLDGLNNLARYLSGLPGKKNLIWFSGSFPLNILPDPTLSNPFTAMADFAEEFHETTTLLARAQVAVYPIDARGVMTGQMLDASDPGTKYATNNPKALMTDQQKFFTNTADEHSTMFAMATETGGKAFVNTNGISDAVQKVTAAGSNYYTLVYSPVNKDWAGEFRKVQVQMAKAGYTLAYRQGYYADDPDAAVNKKEPKAAEGAPLMLGGGRGMGGGRGGGGGDGMSSRPGANPLDPQRAAMRAAMQFGGPGPTQILFKAAINPATGASEKEVVKGNRPDPKLSGPYERLVVYIAAVPADFDLTVTPEGKHRLAAEFVTRVYNGNGETLNEATLRAVRDLDDSQYAALQRAGLQFRQEISVPVKGASFLRIGLHDLRTDHVGAIEIPVSTAVKQKPLAAPGPAVQPAKPAAVPVSDTDAKAVTVDVAPSLKMARFDAPGDGVNARAADGDTGDRVRRLGPGITPPIVLFSPEPTYTEDARAKKIGGNILVYLQVNKQGLAQNVRILRGLGYGLDESAVKAVKGYKFKPATENGQPVVVEMNIETSFKIF